MSRRLYSWTAHPLPSGSLKYMKAALASVTHSCRPWYVPGRGVPVGTCSPSTSAMEHPDPGGVSCGSRELSAAPGGCTPARPPITCPRSVARAAPDARLPHVTRTASHAVAESQASPRRAAPVPDSACGTPTGSRVPRRARVRGGVRCALTPGRAQLNHPRAAPSAPGPAPCMTSAVPISDVGSEASRTHGAAAATPVPAPNPKEPCPESRPGPGAAPEPGPRGAVRLWPGRP